MVKYTKILLEANVKLWQTSIPSILSGAYFGIDSHLGVVRRQVTCGAGCFDWDLNMGLLMVIRQ